MTGGVRLAQSELLESHIEQPAATVSRGGAEQLGVAEGDTVTVSTSEGSVDLPVKVNRLLPDNVVRIPRNLSGAPAEQLLNGHGVSAIAEVTKATVQEPA